MPKKFTGENSKVTAARDRKAVVQTEKNTKSTQAKEAEEAATWEVGVKTSKRGEEQKRNDKLERKAEAARLLAQEERELSATQKSQSMNSVKSNRARNPVTVGGSSSTVNKPKTQQQALKNNGGSSHASDDIPIYSASGIDAALDLVVLATGSTQSSDNTKLDRHPERRAKAAWLAYKERELPMVKAENPSLRLSQLEQILWKQWQISKENPFNQQTAAYNASTDAEKEAVRKHKADALEGMRIA